MGAGERSRAALMWTDISGGLDTTPAPGHCHCPAMCCPRAWRDSALAQPRGQALGPGHREISLRRESKGGWGIPRDRLKVFDRASPCLIPFQGKDVRLLSGPVIFQQQGHLWNPSAPEMSRVLMTGGTNDGVLSRAWSHCTRIMGTVG